MQSYNGEKQVNKRRLLSKYSVIRQARNNSGGTVEQAHTTAVLWAYVSIVWATVIFNVATSDFHNVQLKGNKKMFDEAWVVLFQLRQNIQNTLFCISASSCLPEQLS